MDHIPRSLLSFPIPTKSADIIIIIIVIVVYSQKNLQAVRQLGLGLGECQSETPAMAIILSNLNQIESN
jgi:hypothetical protein